MQSINTQKGFTLIELLVVISIIGLLSSIVLASLTEARTKAKNIAALESARQASLTFILSSDSSGSFPDLGNGTHCLTENCIIAGSTFNQSGALVFENTEKTGGFAYIKALFAQEAFAQLTGFRTPEQTEVVSGLPGGDYQGIFYYSPDSGVNGYLYFPLKGDDPVCTSGYTALSNATANGVLCGQKIGETSQEVYTPSGGFDSSQ